MTPACPHRVPLSGSIGSCALLEARGLTNRVSLMECRACQQAGPPEANPVVERLAGLWERSHRREPNIPAQRFTVAVVVICHNYGRFLAEALESAIRQTAPPAEILVVDDSSTDDTAEVARAFAARWVRYLRVEAGNVHQARRAGYEATSADVLCFLDADDRLPPDYLSSGLSRFTVQSVGVVYSDLVKFGDDAGKTCLPESFSRELLERDNFIHAGSLVRREVLDISRVFEIRIDPLHTQADWFMWRHALRDGWEGRKQQSCYHYRQHGTNWSQAMLRESRGYFDYAGLAHETLTLFVPLSGRADRWPALAAYLDHQVWPHDRVRLVLCDTSQNDSFHERVKAWVWMCDYQDVRLYRQAVSRPRVADEDRHDRDTADEVRRAMARIYNGMARDVGTDYVWIIEDDVTPPLDAAERLLRGFCPLTASVSGVYLSRYDHKPCAWDADCHHYETPGDGLQPIHGNGFGCVMLRGGLLRRTAFSAKGNFDYVFYNQLRDEGLTAKVDWSLACAHGDSEKTQLTIGNPPVN